MWRLLQSRALAASLPRARALVAGAAAASLGAAASSALAEPAQASAPPPSAPPPPAAAASSPLDPIRDAYNSVRDAVYDNVIKPYAEPSRDKLLPDQTPQARERPTLVLGLDGCLIESTWSRQYGWRYVKRPGLDRFLASLAPYYELVLWTDAMNTADPVVDRLDTRRLIRHRLYRDTTTFRDGMHIKDLGALNRDLRKVLIVDSAAECFSLHPEHGIALTPYKSADDPEQEDRELAKLVRFLVYLAVTRKEDLSAELRELRGGAAAGDDVGTAFEKKLPELKEAGKLFVPRKGATNTIWDRLRSK